MPSLSTALTVLAVLSAGVGVLMTMWRTKDRPAGVLDVVLAVSIATACTAIGIQVLPRMVSRVVSGFGTFHAVYIGVTVALPIIGACIAVMALRGRSGQLTVALCVALILLAPLGWYMTHIEPEWLRTDTIDVPVDPARTDTQQQIRVAVLADLQTAHVGDHERAAVQAIMDGRPDVIVIPGDLYQPRPDRAEADLPALRDLLATLEAPDGVYFTQGDHEDPALIARLLERTGITVLDDEVVEVDVRGRPVLLGGTTSAVGSPGADDVRARLMAEPEDGATTVLVSHRPDTVLYLPMDSRVDLTIAGHSHGGQVVIPGFGPPMTLSKVPRTVARGGLHAVDGNSIYVSPGVGLERGDAPQLRLFSRPAVALLDLA